MSSLRAPGLGPIIGHTTPRSCRLWIRAADPRDKGADIAEDRRTVGVITVLKDNGKPDPRDKQRTHYFRLHRQFDRSGTFNVGVDNSFRLEGGGDSLSLEPNKVYRVRMGTLSFDDVFENDESVDSEILLDRLPPPTVWARELANLPPEKSEGIFRTFLDAETPPFQTKRFSFLIGSCRYPGILWKKKEADAIFRPMLDHVVNNPFDSQPRFVLMVGDQIYADMFSRMIPFGLADTYEEFQSRYHDAFGSRNMRQLLRSIPHYMILDDHEIEDNWTQDRIEDRQKRMVFNLAIGAYMSYQWSHGPRTFGRRLYYTFEYGGFPFFVLDERTQRCKDDVEGSLEDNHLLGRPSLDPSEPSQLDRLCHWLTKQQERDPKGPKFIVSGSVFVPNSIRSTRGEKQKDASDSWPAFPTTRRALLDHIITEEIQNVVFLSGDIHCSCIAKMTFSGSEKAKQLKAFAITSSAFYWPFPFADGDPSNYVHNSKGEGQKDTFVVNKAKGITMDYEAFNFTQEDNFCQIDVDREQSTLMVRTIGKDGKLLSKTDREGKPVGELVSTLHLAS